MSLILAFFPWLLSNMQYEKTSQEGKKLPVLEETTNGFNLCSLPEREKMEKGFEKYPRNGHFWKMEKGFEKCQKWAFLKHQAYLGFNGPSKQISAELNTPSGVISPLGRYWWQWPAKLGLPPLHSMVWTFSFLPPVVLSRPCWLSDGPCWSCLLQCLKCLPILRSQFFSSLA